MVPGTALVVLDALGVEMAPGEFWGEQLLMAHPLYLPLWAAGAVGLLLLMLVGLGEIAAAVLPMSEAAALGISFSLSK